MTKWGVGYTQQKIILSWRRNGRRPGHTLARTRRRMFSQRIAEIIVNKFNRLYAFNPSGRRDQAQAQGHDGTPSPSGPPPTSPSGAPF